MRLADALLLEMAGFFAGAGYILAVDDRIVARRRRNREIRRSRRH